MCLTHVHVRMMGERDGNLRTRRMLPETLRQDGNAFCVPCRHSSNYTLHRLLSTIVSDLG